LPVHHDNEYRVNLEKEELLKMLGVGVEPEEFRRLNINSTLDGDDPHKQSRIVSIKTDRLRGSNRTNMQALLRVIVLQNELVLHSLKRLEENMSPRPKPFNPADWK